jgi:hypothetical protein
VIIEYAARNRLPFAVVPCCSDNGLPYKPWMRHLAELARTLGMAVEEATLPMPGRARVLAGTPGDGRVRAAGGGVNDSGEREGA